MTTVTETKQGHYNVTCDCGKPIIKSDKYGMWCEDRCNRDKSIKAVRELNDMFGGMFDDII